MAKSKTANKKYIFTYQTKNLVNGKTYIGVRCTNNLNDGYIGCGVVSDAYAKSIKRKGIKSAFVDSVLKYGYDNFRREILSFYDTKEEAYEEESFLVDRKWVESKDNYNIALGGFGGRPKFSTTIDQEEIIFKDFMSGMKKVDICKKHNVGESIIYRITKNRDTSDRNIKKTKRQKFVKDYISKNSESIIQSYLSGESKDSINKRIPIDLYRSGVLNGITRKEEPKYTLLLDCGEFHFSDVKDAEIKTGEKLFESGIRSCCNGKIKKYKGFLFLFYKEYLKGARSNGWVSNEKESKYKNIKLKKGENIFMIENSLSDFCQKNKLPYSSMQLLLSGGAGEYKGYRLA